MDYNQLQLAVKDAREKVGEFKFRELIDSMPARYETVIDAEGRFAKY